MRQIRNQARWFALLVLIGLALYLCWLMLRPFAEVLAWAAVLVIVFHPVHKRLLARPKRPGASALLSCLLVIMTIVLPLSLLALALIHELSGFAQSLQTYVSSLLDPNSPVT